MSSKASIDNRSLPIWPQRVSDRLQFLRAHLGEWWWWIYVTMILSDRPYIGKLFTWLAGLPIDCYRGKKVLARVKTYISPKAQISCPDLEIGHHCYIDDFVTIYGYQGNVMLGNQVHLYRGTIIEVGQGGSVAIGEYTHIQPSCKLNGFVSSVKIGSKVMVAANCAFTSYQHKLDDLSRAMGDQELTSKGDIIIEDDVWLGMGVKVMDGVRIGRGAVIGANAVVTRDIPPYSIAVGVPARVIRKREHIECSE